MRRLLLLCTSLLVLLVPATVVSAASVDIGHPSAKLRHVVVSDTLQCQARYAGDAHGEFFGGAADGSTAANCGTTIAIGSAVYGFRGMPFTPVFQNVYGSGSEADPRTVETIVNAGSTGIGILQIDRYVYGEESYETEIAVSNTGSTAKQLRLYRLGDCYLQDADRGYGFKNDATGEIGCSENPNNQPQGRVIGYLPLSAGSSRYEGYYGTGGVYGKVEAGQSLPNTCDCTTNQDNGMAISWDLDVDADATEKRSSLTFFSPGPDIDAPTGMRIDVPANGSAINTPQPVFAGVASIAGGDVPTAYLHVFKGADTTVDPFAYQEIPVDSQGKWSAKLNVETILGDGVHTAYVAQTDSQNNVGRSPAIAFEVDTKVPAPTVTAPAEGTTVGQRPLFAGTAGNTAGDAASVTVLLDGPGAAEAAIGDVKNEGGRWVWQPTSDLIEGAWELKVRQRDDAGNVGTSPTVKFVVAAGATQFTGELPPAGTPNVIRTPPAVTKVASTKTKKRMPNLVGLRIDKARDALAKAKINMDLDIVEVKGTSTRFSIGDVMTQSPARNKTVVSDAQRRAKVKVRVFQGAKPGVKKCPAPGALDKALKGMDLDVALRVLKANGCEVNLNLESKSSGTEPEIKKVADGRGSSITVTVNVPARPSGQDLFLLIRTPAGSEFKGLDVTDWSLPTSQKKNALQVQVIDRAGRFVQNAHVRFDSSAVDFRGDASGTTEREGEPNVSNRTNATGINSFQAGTLKILATATGRDGQTLHGYAQVAVRDKGQTEWETTNGLSFSGDVCRVGPRNAATAQGCVTNWLGSQVIPEELGRTTVSGIGPSVDGTSEGAYARLAPLLADALSWDPAVVRLWQSTRLTAVNKMRNMTGNPGYLPAQLAIQGQQQIHGSAGGARYAVQTLNRINGGRKETASGNQVLATSDNVIAAVKPGLYSLAGGQGRVVGGTKATVDARDSNVVTFADGTSVLDDGTANPPWAAGRNGAVAIISGG